ncbi:F-box domain-containing protein [Mycena kentingensis (nom. inval.)]|nr:F-box domain-containing protein [Mycena kentingensis (nom. inval.)]
MDGGDSSISRLPEEILTDIFREFIPPYPETCSVLGLRSPETLAQICKHWRAIAYADPLLWRAPDVLNVGAGKASWMASAPVLRAQIAALARWLARSQGLPLSITMGETGFMNEAAKALELRAQVLDLLLAHCKRWEYAQLRIADSGLGKGFVSGYMPALRELDVEMEWSTLQRVVAPNLQTLMIQPESLGHDAIHGRLPWETLTRLVLTYVSPGVAGKILNETRCLVDCWLNFHVPDDRDFNAPTPPDTGVDWVVSWLRHLVTAGIPRVVNLPETLHSLVLLGSKIDMRSNTMTIVDLYKTFCGARSLQRLAVEELSGSGEGPPVDVVLLKETALRLGWLASLKRVWIGSDLAVDEAPYRQLFHGVRAAGIRYLGVARPGVDGRAFSVVAEARAVGRFGRSGVAYSGFGLTWY